MPKSRLLFAVAGLIGLSYLAAAQAPTDNPCVKPANRDNDRHKAFVAKAKTAGPVDVVFIGDSITQGWEGAGKDVWAKQIAPLKAFNLGIGGDRTEHVLWRLIDGKELADLNPKVAVLMIGTNNSGGNSAEQIAAGIKAIVEELRKQKPAIKVLVLGVFPRAKKQAEKGAVAPAADVNPKIGQINAIISKLDDGKNVKYLDIGGKFLDAQGGLPGKLMPDYLHLSPEGYKIWADAIEKPVAELLKG